MARLTRMGSFVKRWRLSAFVVAVTIIVCVLGARQQVQINDAKHQANINSLQNEQLERANRALGQFVLDLQAEAKERTLESCLSQAASRETFRKALLGIIDETLPKDANGNPVPLPPAQQARVNALRQRIMVEIPTLTCPDDSTIIIPTPSTTEPPG